MLASCFALAAFAPVSGAERAPLELRHEIVAAHPHDASAFTQGLVLLGATLLESTGGYGRSELRATDPESGKPVARRALAAEHFGEGLAVAGARIVQLTWRNGVALLYHPDLRPAGRLRYAGEGWGLTFDGRRFLMTDGSAALIARDPASFVETGRVTVRDRGRPVARLNELEYAFGRVFANVWGSDRIAVIEPETGAVEAWLDLAELRRAFVKPPAWNPAEDVLNGIAFRPERQTFYVTGKRWPTLFEIRVLGPDGRAFRPGAPPPSN